MSLAYLWKRSQPELLQEMIHCQMDARIIKICSMGLLESHLGKSIETLQPLFMKLKDQCGFNVCGEGGEFESAVFDCPLFKTHCIELKSSEIVTIDPNEYAPVSYLRLTGLELVEKDRVTIQSHQALLHSIRKSLTLSTLPEIKLPPQSERPSGVNSAKIIATGMVYSTIEGDDSAKFEEVIN